MSGGVKHTWDVDILSIFHNLATQGKGVDGLFTNTRDFKIVIQCV